MSALLEKLAKWKKKATAQFAFWRFRHFKKIDYCHYDGWDYYRI